MMGPRTEEACGEFAPDLPRWSYEEFKLMGITEMLPAIPRLLRLRRTMVRAILERSPEAIAPRRAADRGDVYKAYRGCG